MYCQNCGQSNPATASQCASCGVTLAIAAPPQPAPRQHVDNYLLWAILATVLCCIPTGIVAIVFSARVDGKAAAGDIEGAIRDANNAKLWSWISFGIGMLVIVLWFGLIMVGAVADSSGY